MARNEITFRFKVEQRTAEVKAYDTVGVEDAMNIQMRAALHRVMTGEDWTEPVAREVKNWIIRTHLFI